mgnify:CR=1 FL=1
MPDDMEPTSQKQVTLIPTDRIRILNPRVRNRRTFEAMVANIARIGLNCLPWTRALRTWQPWTRWLRATCWPTWSPS